MKRSPIIAALSAALLALSMPAAASAAGSAVFLYEHDGVTLNCSIDVATEQLTILSAETTGTSDKLVIPEEINGYPVTGVAERAFAGCLYLENIVFPDTVTVFGKDAFMSCAALETVSAKGVEIIPEGCFFACPSLGRAEFSPAMKSIGKEAFFGCTELDIRLPDTVEEIGEKALGYEADPHNGTIVPVYDFIIIAKEGSAGEKYAEENGFEMLDPMLIASGDIDGNGKPDASDASRALVEYSCVSTGQMSGLSRRQKKMGDMDGNGKIDASDASTILVIYSKLSTTIQPEDEV